MPEPFVPDEAKGRVTWKSHSVVPPETILTFAFWALPITPQESSAGGPQLPSFAEGASGTFVMTPPRLRLTPTTRCRGSVPFSPTATMRSTDIDKRGHRAIRPQLLFTQQGADALVGFEHTNCGFELLGRR